MANNKSIKIISICVFLVVIIIIGISYMFFSYPSQNKNDDVECSLSYNCKRTIFGYYNCSYKSNWSNEEKKLKCSSSTITDEQKIEKNTKKNGNVVNIYVFYGDGCPHCEHLLEFLDELKEDSNYGNKFNVIKYQVWDDEENMAKLNKVIEHFDTTYHGVPFYVIGDNYYTGFANLEYMDENDKKDTIDRFKSRIDEAYTNGYFDIESIINN